VFKGEGRREEGRVTSNKLQGRRVKGVGRRGKGEG